MSEFDHEPEARPDADRSARIAPPLPAAAAPSEELLALQRTIGNRAVGRMLARQEASGRPSRQLMRRPTQVRTYLTDGPYGIAGAFEVELSPGECMLTIRARVVPDRGVSTAELERVKRETREAFERFWDGKFILTDTRTSEQFFLRVQVVYVDRGGHTRIRLRQNRRDRAGNIIDGRDDQTTWFVHSISVDRAHELSHQLGLRDEYIDAAVRARRNASASGVFQDHSLMGNYYTEGRDVAEVKLRHGEQLARSIGRATRRRFRASLSGYFQGERLIRWRGIAAGAAAGSAERTAADAEVRAIETDMMIPQLEALVGAGRAP
jgi:hypothetical protein